MPHVGLARLVWRDGAVVIVAHAPHTHNLSHLGMLVFPVLGVDTDACGRVALHLAGIQVARRIKDRRRAIPLMTARMKTIDDGIPWIDSVPTTPVSNIYCSEHRATADDFCTCLEMMPFIGMEPHICPKSARNSTKHARGPLFVGFAIVAEQKLHRALVLDRWANCRRLSFSIRHSKNQRRA